MFIVTTPNRLIPAPAEPNVAATRTHIALRWSAMLGAGGGYKHLVPPGPKKCLSNTPLPHYARF